MPILTDKAILWSCLPSGPNNGDDEDIAEFMLSENIYSTNVRLVVLFVAPPIKVAMI